MKCFLTTFLIWGVRFRVYNFIYNFDFTSSTHCPTCLSLVWSWGVLVPISSSFWFNFYNIYYFLPNLLVLFLFLEDFGIWTTIVKETSCTSGVFIFCDGMLMLLSFFLPSPRKLNQSVKWRPSMTFWATCQLVAALKYDCSHTLNIIWLRLSYLFPLCNHFLILLVNCLKSQNALKVEL